MPSWLLLSMLGPFLPRSGAFFPVILHRLHAPMPLRPCSGHLPLFSVRKKGWSDGDERVRCACVVVGGEATVCYVGRVVVWGAG